MLLSPQDAELFFKLHRRLMFFVNERLQIVPGISSPEEYSGLEGDVRLEVHEAFLANTDLIEVFVDQNPFDLPEEELDVVLSWRHHVAAEFYIFRYLKKYTVFLSTDEQPIAYGVLALSQPFQEMMGPYLPVWTETVLLPFKGRIVYDSLLYSYNVSFGPGIRRSLNESYKEAKERRGIVTTLPLSETPAAFAPSKRTLKARRKLSRFAPPEGQRPGRR